jgi:hypothetical protein
MLKFLKMTAAEDVTTITVAAEEALDQEEKAALLQDVKVLAAVLGATEVQLHVKEVSEAKEAHLLQEEKVVSEETKAVPTELQDVLRVLAILQDQEDQEEINFNFLIYQSQIPNRSEFGIFFITVFLSLSLFEASTQRSTFLLC